MIAAYEPQRADRPDYLFFRRQTNQRTPLHFHACYEYLCCTQGMLRIQIDGKTYDLKAGEAAVIFPYQIHTGDHLIGQGAETQRTVSGGIDEFIEAEGVSHTLLHHQRCVE